MNGKNRFSLQRHYTEIDKTCSKSHITSIPWPGKVQPLSQCGVSDLSNSSLVGPGVLEILLYSFILVSAVHFRVVQYCTIYHSKRWNTEI